jgi:hypothetical protein
LEDPQLPGRKVAPICIIIIAALALTLAVSARARFAGAQTPPAGYAHFTPAVSLWVDGSNVVIQANAVPDHKSPYFFPTTDPRYEAYNGTNPNWAQNPNHIGAQTIEFRIPANPQVAATHAATPLGPIGVAVNGVPLFNQYAGPNQPLTNEVNSFDQYDGHPQQTSMYHYHVEPYALTAVNGSDSLIGYLLDGFPVYGPQDNGVTITNADLDQYHGHIHATADYPQGIYHYHVTAAAPYINGTGFYGTAGTVSYQFSASPTPSPTSTPAATPTVAPVPSVGGIAQDPDLTQAPTQRAATSHANAIARAALASAALAATLICGRWYALRRRKRQP